jgi:hypothetical protein
MLKSALEISKYRFTLEAVDEITMPAYKGSTFHGGFGHALMKISPTWYRYFFEPGLNQKGDWPKPFVILPPLDKKEKYTKGQQFHCDLTLFGEATQQYAIAQAAIEYLGLQMGLGYEQGKYKFIDIEHTQPSQEHKTNQTIDQRQIKLYLPTRLRLKKNNKLQRHSPSFLLFLTRLTGRLKTLETAYGETQGNYQELIYKARNIKIANSHTKWDDWDRFSCSQKKWMKFGGLLGDISYAGDLQPFMEVLKLGEWLHIGNKTSFGLGKYELKYQGENT